LRLDLALADETGLLWLQVPLGGDARCPDLSGVFANAGRMQRAAFDLAGVRATGGDSRKWLRHGAWPAGAFPLRHDFAPCEQIEPDNYPFVRVEGEGVHEIAVGPVHAGIIEPGHFRFSVVGEEVLRLEQRLGYKHKGIDRLFQGMNVSEGARLAGRISGDSTVAYAWAYAMAVESAAQLTPPPRALWLRALMLERERVANHLGDLGALGNDGGLAFGLSQFMRLKEMLLRLNARVLGHRLLMDLVVPGGVARDLDRAALELVLEQCDAIEREVHSLKNIYEEHAGLQDRFLSCGVLATEMVVKLGVSGLAARASALGRDVRSRPGFAPYELLDVHVATRPRGDVAARALVRFDEVFESLRLMRSIAERIAPGDVRSPWTAPATGGSGMGWVEGWRGDVLVAIETGPEGRLASAHAHDPSWQNWPALEHAVIGNIVPDFPLINKSFNLSYSGQDL
jgi:Ni,Fe-hydrogenase III large subunit